MTIQEIKEKANDWPETCIQALCDHVEALEEQNKTFLTIHQETTSLLKRMMSQVEHLTGIYNS